MRLNFGSTYADIKASGRTGLESASAREVRLTGASFGAVARDVLRNLSTTFWGTCEPLVLERHRTTDVHALIDIFPRTMVTECMEFVLSFPTEVLLQAASIYPLPRPAMSDVSA